MVVSFSNNKNPKSKLGFRKWTFINVQNGEPKQCFQKGPLKRRL